jgi:cell wall-associated NlpC family hydrolase
MNKKEILESIINNLLGKPYIWGGCNPNVGYDCSGFVLELLKSVGLFPSHGDLNAQGIANYFKAIEGKPMQLGFGDLIFFGEDSKKITHIGFALNNELFVEAGGGTAACIDLASSISANAYIRIRPIISRKDLVAVASPNYKFEVNV